MAGGRGEGVGEHAGLRGGSLPPFLSKTYDMVDDPSTDSIVSWGQGNNSFVVWNHLEFARDLLPKYFKHNNFSSFIRQLNTYGFRKVDPDRWEFANEGFLRSQKHLLKTISRRKSIHAPSLPPQPQGQSASVGACVEVGKFGLEEEIERLIRDRNVLMQELVRLRQHQQATDQQLKTLGQRFQVMEQRQQQMMSFLAKAMQSSGFLSQFVHQNDANRRIAVVKKKRRLPKQEADENGEQTHNEGQIIKYQLNEATGALLMQFFNLASIPWFESPAGSPDSFLIDSVPSTSEILNTGNSSSQVSGVTLAEEKPTCGPSKSFATSGLPGASHSEMQASSGGSNTVANSAELSDADVVSGMQEPLDPVEAVLKVLEFPQVPGLIPASVPSDIANGAYVAPTSDSGYINYIPVGGPMPITGENFSSDANTEFSFDEMSIWTDISDFLLQGSPMSEEIEGVESCGHDVAAEENLPRLEVKENRWRNANMDQLTQQMGLLSSESNG